jgi:hypothetical protein
MSLEDFLKKHKTTTRDLFALDRNDKHHVVVFAPATRNILQKIVTYVTKRHKDGFAWDDSWEISHWDVFDNDCMELRPALVRFDA